MSDAESLLLSIVFFFENLIELLSSRSSKQLSLSLKLFACPVREVNGPAAVCVEAPQHAIQLGRAQRALQAPQRRAVIVFRGMVDYVAE